MATHPITIDISNNPDLVRLMEEMKNAKQPRILEENNKPVAMLMPMGHSALEVFDFQPLGVVKKGFLDAGYPEAEVNDMLEVVESHKVVPIPRPRNLIKVYRSSGVHISVGAELLIMRVSHKK